MAELDFVRVMGRIRVIGPGFEQQHRSVRICSQTAGQRTSSRSPADDSNHRSLSYDQYPNGLKKAPERSAALA